MADETEKLIELVREYVHLYDTRHSDYKNVVKKSQSWKEIADKLHQTSDAVKMKWKNLRDSYVKYLKFIKGSTGSAKKFQNWPWEGHLEFLQDKLSPRPTISNVSQSSETLSCHDKGNDDVCETDNSQMPPPKKAKSKEGSADVDKVKTKLDRTDNLFLSYAETFKKFMPKTPAIIKMEMAQLFGQAELRDLDATTPLPSSLLSSTNTSWSDNSNYVANFQNEVHYTDLDAANTITRALELPLDSTNVSSAKELYESGILS